MPFLLVVKSRKAENHRINHESKEGPFMQESAQDVTPITEAKNCITQQEMSSTVDDAAAEPEIRRPFKEPKFPGSRFGGEKILIIAIVAAALALIALVVAQRIFFLSH